MKNNFSKLIIERFIKPSNIKQVYFLVDNNYIFYDLIASDIKDIGLYAYTFSLDELDKIKHLNLDTDTVMAIISLEKEYNKISFEICKKIEESKCKCLYFSWVDERFSSKVRTYLEKKYTQALLTDYSLIKKFNDLYYEKLKNSNEIYVKCKNGTNIVFHSSGIIHTETGDFIQDKVCQLPCGEVFMVPLRSSCNGIIVIEGEEINIVNDISDFSTNSSLYKLYNGAPLCEFGVGTNPNVSNIKGLPISEKSYGTCHFGFGNNISFGGTYNYKYHFDLVINQFEIYIDGVKF